MHKMAAREQIGSSEEVKLLNQILRQLERLTAVVAKVGATTTTTTTNPV